jgi:hypothetical protein
MLMDLSKSELEMVAHALGVVTGDPANVPGHSYEDIHILQTRIAFYLFSYETDSKNVVGFNPGDMAAVKHHLVDQMSDMSASVRAKALALHEFATNLEEVLSLAEALRK